MDEVNFLPLLFASIKLSFKPRVNLAYFKPGYVGDRLGEILNFQTLLINQFNTYITRTFLTGSFSSRHTFAAFCLELFHFGARSTFKQAWD